MTGLPAAPFNPPSALLPETYGPQRLGQILSLIKIFNGSLTTDSGKTQPSVQEAKVLHNVAPVYLSTLLTSLPSPPTLQYGHPGYWVSPDSPMLFYASKLFPLPGKSFLCCLLSKLFLISEAPA